MKIKKENIQRLMREKLDVDKKQIPLNEEMAELRTLIIGTATRDYTVTAREEMAE